MSVSVYIREHGTRCYIPANPKPTYPAGTAFVLRDEQHRKRKWKTLPRHVLNVKAATIQAKLLEAKLLQGAEEPTGSGHHSPRHSLSRLNISQTNWRANAFL